MIAALLIFVTAVLLLPAKPMLIATVVILAIAVVSIWARDHLAKQSRDFEEAWELLTAVDVGADEISTRDQKLAANPVAAIGSVPR